MKTGLDILMENPRKYLGSGRVGIVANPTTVNKELHHAIDLLAEHPDVDLRILFGPEHGVRAAAQDMIGVGDDKDGRTGLPVVSLYGKTFASLSPSVEEMKKLDTLIFDIQDVGSRYYTYAATMALCMQVAAPLGVKIVVLDRPNPIGGGKVEGGGLTPGLENFCALYPVPQRHGMTVGELANLYNTTFKIGCELEVVACEGWKRHQYYDEIDYPWVMPSPNMPTLETAIVYPGMCLLEGTQLSEARGTTRPFELVGAPYVDGYALRDKLLSLGLEGIAFRPTMFEPTFHKFKEQSCGGIQLHVTHRDDFNSYKTGLAVIWATKQLWPNDFKWRDGVYEFRDDEPAIDLLTGFAEVRVAIDNGESFDTVLKHALQGTELYGSGREAALIYD